MKSKILPTFAEKVQKRVVHLNMKQIYAAETATAELVLKKNAFFLGGGFLAKKAKNPPPKSLTRASGTR